MATRTLQIGVIGIGWYAGTALIPQLRAAGRAEIVAIARRSADRLALEETAAHVLTPACRAWLEQGRIADT